jgi:D-xylose transport system permease protein
VNWGALAEAARRAGINVIGIRLAVFTMASTLAAIGGVLSVARNGAALTAVDPGLLLNAIAAAVIGGVSLFGGRGSVWAVVLGALVLGALVLGSLSNGLFLLSQPASVQFIVEGAVLALAVDALLRRRSAAPGR